MQRYAKQQTDLAWLAWILGLLKRYTPTERHGEAIEDFFAFRGCEGKFGRWRDSWKKDCMEKPSTILEDCCW